VYQELVGTAKKKMANVDLVILIKNHETCEADLRSQSLKMEEVTLDPKAVWFWKLLSH
jgi:hypothetical protein